MRALKIIGIIILVLIGLFFLVAAFLPKEVHISEMTSIEAPASIVFEQVNDLQNWDPWTPFTTPEMEITFDGPSAGVGAIMKWDDKARQKGTMEIKESTPYTSIKTTMEFMQDTDVSTTADWTFEEIDGKTKVSWTLDITGMSYPVGRYMAVVFPSLMKPIYQKGLDSLKSVCESQPQFHSSEIMNADLPAGYALTITDSVAADGFTAFFDMAFGTLFNYIMTQGQMPAGMPYAKYLSWDETGKEKTLTEAGMPVAMPLEGNDTIKFVELPAVKTVMISHYGPYETIGSSWELLMKYVEDNGLESDGSPWEVYVNDPGSVPAHEIQTDIYWPVK